MSLHIMYNNMIDSTPPKYEHNKCNDNHNENDNFAKAKRRCNQFWFHLQFTDYLNSSHLFMKSTTLVNPKDRKRTRFDIWLEIENAILIDQWFWFTFIEILFVHHFDVTYSLWHWTHAIWLNIRGWSMILHWNAHRVCNYAFFHLIHEISKLKLNVLPPAVEVVVGIRFKSLKRRKYNKTNKMLIHIL